MRNDQNPNTRGQGIPRGELKDSEPAKAADDSKASASKMLSAEEQMAAYEEDLKESDWGHQPC
jgi:hypothetical protein